MAILSETDIKILEDYESLEYDEKHSKGKDFLVVRKKDPTERLDISIAHRISRALGEATNRNFLNPNSMGSGSHNPDTDWGNFNIREDRKG